MFRALIRTNSIFSLTQRYISNKVKETPNPSLYASFSNSVTIKKVSDLIEEFADDLINIRRKCMDVGCGPGNVTNNLLSVLDENAVMIGTDVSQDMIEYAKETYSTKGRLEFDVLDIQTKELPKKYVSEFDHIFSIGTLQYCNDIRQAFDNIHRMLRPNGTVLVLFVANHDAYDVLKNLAYDIRYASYIPNEIKNISPYQDSIDPRKELKELLQKLGFKIIHCSLRNSYYTDENEIVWNVDKFATAALSIVEFFNKMPHDVKEEFRKDFINQFMEKKIIYKRGKNKKNNVLDAYKELIVFAQKV